MYQRMYVFYTMNSKLLMGIEKLNQNYFYITAWASCQLKILLKMAVLIWLSQSQQSTIDQVA